MKKKLIAVLITLAMVISMIPMVVFSAQEEEPETGGASNLVLPKKVIWDNEKWDIVTYLNVNLDLELDTADIEAILADISFFIYESNADGDLLDEVEGVTGKILPGTSTISFADKDGPYEFEAGWYVAEEVLGDIAAEYFVDSGATLHFYFNKLTGTVTAGPGAVFDEDTYFTIEQFKDKSRYVHAIYKDEDGVIRTLRTVPPFALPNGMIGGGGSILGTSRFVATQNTGEEFMSFCSDIGAISVKGKYYVDEKNQGMTQEQLLRLIAAVDFVYTRGGFVDYEDIALAQLVVWNLVLEYTNNPMVADGWIQDRDNRITYPEAWGDLIKIEGINHKGPFDWHCEDYRSLIDDILDHAYDDKYVDIYNERIADGADSFVSSGFFLVGDGSFANFEQQLQFTITFGAPVTFDNEPEADKYMGLSILKVVTEDGKSEWISVWLNDVKGLDFDEVEEILDDIEFKLYTSNAAGIEIEEVEGVVGKIDLNTSKITFYKAGVVYDLPTGWYLVREFLGPLAAGYFSSPVPDLHIHFNSKSGAVTPGAGPVFPDDAIFSVEQFKEHSRPLQALFIDEDGVINILKGTAPYLDVPGNIGGGAFGTSRFEVTHKNGDKSKYMSFCADIGAVECYGDYVIDKNNHGFTQEQLLRLVAVIDFIYARSAFADYEDIALAQLAVWNLILEYTDDPMTADLWLQSAGVLYKDVWGKLFKIEGVSEHNGVEYWYITPGYKELIDDIIANAYNDKYVNLYYERIASEVDKYVGAAYFLKGLVGENEEENFPEHLQQRQLMITFNGPVTFNNIPDEGEKQGKIYIDKFVDGDDTGIATWLILEKDMELAKVQALLDDITFELYNSNADGDVLAKVAGVVGEIDILNSVISFLDVTETPPVLYEASTGWYIVREVMGDEAKKFFKDGIDDLHIYFVSETEDVLTGPDGERAVFDNESLKNGGLNISAAANLQTSSGEYKEYWQGERTPYKYYKQSSEGSVTATNSASKATIVPNSNHFCYATLDKATLANGITLDLVVGNKINKVGTCFVKLVNGKIVISFNDVDSASFVLAIANVPFTGTNGNVHANNNNYTTYKNLYEINCPDWNTIYLYIHGDFKFLNDITSTKPGYDPATGYVWVEKAPVLIKTEKGDPVFKTASLDVFVKVLNAAGDKVAEFTLNGDDADEGKKTLSGLPVGIYTVEWTFDYAKDATVYKGTIEVKAGETVTFPHISASYSEGTVWTEHETSPILLPPIIKPVVTVK